MKNLRNTGLVRFIYESLIIHSSSGNLSYLWNFGVYSMVCLMVQILTGIFLAMHYTPELNLAFSSVEHIMRDVNYGWLIRYIHSNGASMFFIVVYIHTFRGFYYGSYLYPREFLWIVGVAILLIMILTAFLGYVLPWGQMSYWGATVITNLVSAIPKIGGDVVVWLWGGPSVNNATLNRFFSFHYLFPFIILALVIVHILLLHEFGSNNPLGLGGNFGVDNRYFYPYFIVKDLFGIILFLLFFSLFVFFSPNVLGHSDNYILASPLVTPPHIVPEWYFLPFYAILRSIPDKIGGVVALIGSILVLMVIPFLAYPEKRGFSFKPLGRWFFWFVVVCCLFLGWIGGEVVEYPYLEIGQLMSVFYFAAFLLILPVLEYLDNWFWTNKHYLSKFNKCE